MPLKDVYKGGIKVTPQPKAGKMKQGGRSERSKKTSAGKIVKIS